MSATRDVAQAIGRFVRKPVRLALNYRGQFPSAPAYLVRVGTSFGVTDLMIRKDEADAFLAAVHAVGWDVYHWTLDSGGAEEVDFYTDIWVSPVRWGSEADR